MKTSQHLLYYVSSGDLVVTMRTGSSWPTRKYTPSVDSDAAYYVGANKTWYIIKSKFTNDWNLSDKDWAGVVTDVPLPGGGGTFNSGTGQVTTTPAYAGDVNLSGKPTLVGSYDPNNPNCKILIQNALNYLGYTDANGSKLVLDGDIGAKSQYALEQFQNDYNARHAYGSPAAGSGGVPSQEAWAALQYALAHNEMAIPWSDPSATPPPPPPPATVTTTPPTTSGNNVPGGQDCFPNVGCNGGAGTATIYYPVLLNAGMSLGTQTVPVTYDQLQQLLADLRAAGAVIVNIVYSTLAAAAGAATTAVGMCVAFIYISNFGDMTLPVPDWEKPIFEQYARDRAGVYVPVPAIPSMGPVPGTGSPEDTLPPLTGAGYTAAVASQLQEAFIASAKAGVNARTDTTTNEEKHHIVARNDTRAAMAQTVLAQVGINRWNDLDNIIPLKYSFHKVIHSAAVAPIYFKWVNALMYVAYTVSSNNNSKAVAEVTVRLALNGIKGVLGTINNMAPPV